MRFLQNKIGAAINFHLRKNTNAKNKAEVVGMKKRFNSNKCLDCSNHVPAYLNFYCERHWEKYLNEKLVTDDAKKIIIDSKR